MASSLNVVMDAMKDKMATYNKNMSELINKMQGSDSELTQLYYARKIHDLARSTALEYQNVKDQILRSES